jgi:hypothetical protein
MAEGTKVKIPVLLLAYPLDIKIYCQIPIPAYSQAIIYDF